MIIDIPGVDQSGRIVLLSHSDGTYPLAAVVGDGTGTNQVFESGNMFFFDTGSGKLLSEYRNPKLGRNFTSFQQVNLAEQQVVQNHAQPPVPGAGRSRDNRE